MRKLRWLLVAAVLGALLGFPAAVGAATPISVQVFIGQSCVFGSGPADKPVLATLRTPGGKKRGEFRTRSDDFGGWIGCFQASIAPTLINGGDRLRIETGAQVRTIVVPHLVPDIDRVADLVQGSAEPFTYVQVAVSHFKNFKRAQEFLFETFSDDQGHWQIDTTGVVNLRGGDELTAFVQQGNDVFGATVLVPYVLIGHATNFLSGSTNHGTRLEFELTDSAGNPKAVVNSGPIIFGIFQVSMFDEDGEAAYPVGRDWLNSNLAGDANLRVPVSQLMASAADDLVMGRCMANAPYLLLVRNRAFYGKTNSSGRLTRDVGARMNMRRGDDVSLLCMYQTGDIWSRSGIAR